MHLKVSVLLMIALAPAARGGEPAKSEAKRDAVARELKALEGTWEVVSHEINGKKASDAGYYSPRKLVFSAGKVDLYEEEGKADRPIRLDPAKTPKAIDVYSPLAMKLNAHTKGIYALDGDDLKICLPLSGEVERPTKFSSAGYHSLYVLRRKK